MSRLAQRSGATPSKARAGEDGGISSPFKRMLVSEGPTANDTTDICPVCKSSRFLNPNMKFLMNPDCYHKMCESCVDRIFSNGPANCPIAGCRRTLRKHKFRKQTFEDIQVEREVDIRKKVQETIGSWSEDDFKNLKDYNDYLDDIEDITYNLVNRIDEDKSTKRLKEYEDARRQQLQVIKEAKAARKGAKPGQAREQATPQLDFDPAPRALKGLKSIVIEDGPSAYDPFGGDFLERKYFVLQDRYDGDNLAAWRKDPARTAGGYDLDGYYTRALCDAFTGLGVFIGEEPAVSEETAMVDVF